MILIVMRILRFCFAGFYSSGELAEKVGSRGEGMLILSVEI